MATFMVMPAAGFSRIFRFTTAQRKLKHRTREGFAPFYRLENADDPSRALGSRVMAGALNDNPEGRRPEAGSTDLATFTIEFIRIRPDDGRHATLDRLSQELPDLDAAKVRAISLFETLDMPQKPNGLRILNADGVLVFAWSPDQTPGADRT